MLYPDGTGVDKQESDDVLYVQDVQTGELFTIAPNRISELAEATDPQTVIAEREEAIAAAMNQEIEQEEGAASGTAAPTEAPEVRIPAPRFSGARVTLDLPNGSSVNGVVLQETDDGVEVQTDSPVNGRFVQVFPTDEFDGMLSSVRDEAGDVIWSREGAEGENAANGQQREMQGNGIPVDAKTGEPVYDAVAPDVAWDAIVQEAEGDEAMAMQVVTDMVADMEAKVQKAKKAKVRAGSSVREKLEAQKEHKRRIEEAEAQLEAWRRIAAVKAERIAAAERAKIEAAQQREVTQGDETEVPDFVFDKPENARERGYRMQNGQRVDRQEPIAAVVGKEVSVKFTNKVSQPVRVAVVDARSLQPSHQNGQPNVLHFLPEAQPKKRTDHESVHAAEQIAAQMNPEEITSSVTAYTGAPSVNARGEVIQGNNRTAALKRMWQGYPEQAAAYKQYLMDHASEYGLNPEDIAAMEQPVLVNLMDVTDEQAIELGQYDVKDTESGGTERIKPRNVSQKMGDKAERFASILLRTTDEDASVSQLIDEHAVETLKWLEAQHYISPTQYRSAFNADGQVTPEAKNDLRGILYQAVFKNGSERLEDMFNALPTKAQRAILATAYRDFSTPESEKMLPEIQNSIVAFYELSQDAAFANAKNFEEARKATMAWLQQMQFDFSTGQSVSREGKYTNFALTLAAMYKVQTQTAIQQTFNDMFDLLQGRQQPDLYNPNPNNTPRTLAEAIREVLNIEYDGTNGSHALGGNNETRQSGRQGSARDDSAGGTDAPGNAAADAEGGTGRDKGRVGTENEGRGNKEKENDETEVIGSSMTADEALDFIADMELGAEIAPEIDLTIENWDSLFGKEGIVSTPIGNVKMGENQFTKLMRQGRNGKLGMIKPTLEHPHAIIADVSEAKEGDITERASSYVFIRSFKKVDGSRYYYFTSITVSKDGKEVVISNQEKRRNAIANLLTKGKLVWKHADDVSDASDMAQGLYSSQGNVSDLATEGTDAPQTTISSTGKDTPENRAVQTSGQENAETSSEGGISSISHAENQSAPAISLQSRGDVVSISNTTSKDTPQNSAVQTFGQENAETSLQSEVTRAEQQTNAEPTEGQKEAGNYKKGRVKIGPFDVVIEQPLGSVRSGVDANGKAWETTMQNTYGYFGGTKGVDGDAIDVFLGNDLDGWDGITVFVVDQYNPDGSFDEHKVMLGFNSQEEAEAAYFANYEADWAKTHRTEVTAVPLADFTEWVNSSKRKTKAFAEYKVAKRNAEIDAHNAQNEQLAEQLFSMAKESETEKDFFDRAASLFEVTGYESDLRDIYNGVKSGEIANARALSFYTNATLKPVKEGVKGKSKQTETSENEHESKEKAPKPRQHKSTHEAQPTTAETTLRDALVDVAQQSGLEVVVDEKAQQVLDEVNGRARTMAFGEEYDYDRYPEGRVEPNISDKYVHIERAKLDHGFANFNEAKEWAKSHIVRTLDNAESGGKGNVKISSTAVNKYLSESAVAKSDSKDVHLAVLKKLPEIIHDSVDVETTPDFRKDENGVRKVGNEINKNVLIHRCYGAVEINGNIYRVKITLKEYKDKNEANKAYSYEATKIELFAGTLANDRKSTTDPGTNNSISVAKLLKDVEMSYRPGVKVLEESAKQRARLREHRYFRTPSGEAYGFTVDGKIYLDPRIATAETPIHEYAHLWADMIRNVNAEAWNDIVGLMKATPIWEEVRGLYPELKTDDEIADEVLAHYSGRRGAERLREAQQHAAAETGKSVFERAAAVAAIERVKQALAKFWQSVAELFHIRFTSAEEVADRVLADMLNGVNPMAVDEKGRSLAGIHNISEEKLGKALKMGGLANPSLAVIDMAQGSHEGYGEISLIAPSALIDKKKGENAGTFSGDAWTPTYPQVERQFSDDGSSQVYDDLSKLPEAVRPVVRRAWNSYMDGRDADGLAYQFLHEKGMAPEIKKMPTLYPAKIHQMIEASEALEGDAKEQAILDAYIESRFEGSREKFYAYIATRKQFLEKKIAESPVKKGIRYNGMNDSLAEINERGYEARSLYRFASEVEADLRRKGSVDADGTVQDAINQVRESDNLSKEYNKWRNELEERYGIKEVLFSGYAPDGSRTYLPHTLENVSNQMKKEGLAAATGWNGSFSKFAAGLMKNVGTLSAIRKQKGKLTPDHENVESFRKKWEDVYFNLGIKLNPGGSAFDDTGLYRLEEVVTKSNPKAFAKKEYGVELSEEDVQQMKDMVNAIREEYPAMYFETKFERPVRLEEFAAAVVPADASEETKGALRSAGLKLYEYDSNKSGDRKRAMTEAVQAKGIRFQFVGQQGAAALDKSEEATTRLDNLGVAREMERQQKDAKAIKLATGWERGGDGKWRYEIVDGEFDRNGELHPERRALSSEEQQELEEASMDLQHAFKKGISINENEMDMVELYVLGGMERSRAERLSYLEDKKYELSRLPKHLDDYLDNEELYQAYPELRNVRIVEGNRNMVLKGSFGFYDQQDKSITLYSVNQETLVHEVQHAIQYIEGFAEGGSPNFLSARRIKNIFNEVTEQIKQLRAEGKDAEADALIKKNRGLYNAYMNHRGEAFRNYKALGGEVESRNVQKRLHMTPEERRQSLAEETEDVAREDQIFIMDGIESANSLGDKFEAFKGEEAIERLNAFFDIRPSDLPTLPAPINSLDAFKELFANPVRTVLGSLIKVKDRVFEKIARREREMVSGSMLSTLKDADFVIKDTDGSKLYVKRYKNAENEHIYNVTVVNKRDEVEDYISSVHIKSNNNLRNKIEKGAELLLPSKRTRYGEQAPSNSTPAAKVAEKSETSQLPEENNFREGKGELSDDMLSYLNDPMAQMMGKPRGTKKQRAQFAERERGRMQAHAQNLVERLHLPNVEIVTDASQLEGKQRTAKGFYNKRTGKITIVLPNHASTADVEQTLLHEAVAHYGLRQLFGEHFDDFLDMVYRNAEEGIRRKIAEASAKHGWNVRTATEEYLADLAERTDFEHASPQWWAKIKDFFLDMLRGLGFEAMDGQTLTDNELRYVLWRSYENLTEPGKYPTFIAEARDVAKQHALQVGRFAPTETVGSRVAENEALSEEEMSEILFRDGNAYQYTQVLARDRYERRIKSGMYQTKEALQDSMLGLRTAMESILEAEGRKGVYIEDIDGFENAYLGENRLSSVNQAEAEKFAREQFKVSSKKVCGCNIWVRQNVVASYVLVIGKR